jgi:3',5'-cyclic-AMP phosphodiesterase
MKSYIWLTDTHFNFLNHVSLISFFQKLKKIEADGIFLTGDISNGSHVISHLELLQKETGVALYFTLGNHDFFRTFISEMKQSLRNLQNEKLIYLTQQKPITLAPGIGLIGHDGWYDAGWRNPLTPFIFLWDWYFIKDFRSLFGTKERMALIRSLASEAEEFISKNLEAALEKYSTVYLLTHFPPWPEESDKFYGLLEKFWMPYNSSKLVADSILQIMKKHPNKKLIILSGHTHIGGRKNIATNIELRVGSAELGKPEIQEIILI